MKYNIKVGLVKLFVYMYWNILDYRDLFNFLFKIELMKEKINIGFCLIFWEDVCKYVE